MLDGDGVNHHPQYLTNLPPWTKINSVLANLIAISEVLFSWFSLIGQDWRLQEGFMLSVLEGTTVHTGGNVELYWVLFLKFSVSNIYYVSE